MPRKTIGPKIRTSPEQKPQKAGFLELSLDRAKRLSGTLNAAVRSIIGYTDPKIEADCSPGEIRKATLHGWVFVGTPVVMGSLSNLAVTSLAGGEFSVWRFAACFGFAAWVAAADSAILHTWSYHRGLRDLEDGGAYISIPSSRDQTARYIVRFRIAWSFVFGMIVATAIGIATNASAIDQRLTEDDLQRNAPLLKQATLDYNAQVENARIAYNVDRAEVDRLTRLQRRLATNRRRADEMGRQLSLAQQKRDQSQARLNQLLAARPESLRRTLMAMPGYVPQSHDALISKFRGYVEVVHDDVFSAIPALAIEALIVGIDVFNLCLGGLGSLGRYHARSSRRRLEEITEEARLAADYLGFDRDDDDDDPPPSGSAALAVPRPPVPPGPNGATAVPLRRGPGRPRKDPSASPDKKGDDHE